MEGIKETGGGNKMERKMGEVNGKEEGNGGRGERKMDGRQEDKIKHGRK